jgi:hypothetical protein
LKDRDNTNSGIQRYFTLNIGTIIFSAVFIYLVVSLVLYLTSNHVQSYQVTSGPLAKNNTYTGLVLRSEQVVSADSGGYITYYARDNSRVKRYGAVYSVSPSSLDKEGAEISEETLSGIRKHVRDFATGYSPRDYRNVYSLKYTLEGDILDNTLADSPDLVTNTGAPSITFGNQTISTCPVDGMVSYCIDGYENFTLEDITPDTLDRNSYHATDLKISGQIKAGQQVYKVINSENWSLIIPLTSRQIVQMTDKKTMRVKFLSDDVTQNATFSILTSTDGSYYGKLDFTSGVIRYLDSRFLDIELVTNAATGLKVPVTSVVSKKFYTIPVEYGTQGGDSNSVGFLRYKRAEDGSDSTEFIAPTIYNVQDGKYYIDTIDFDEGDIIMKEGTSSDRYIINNTDTLEGVYCTNKGYAVFRRVNIIDKNEQYCLVESGTPYGIAQFDYIVTDSTKVRESQVTAR